MVDHALETQFDATGFPGTRGPTLYVEDIDITLISNETRASESGANGEGWVVGWSLVHDVNRISRSLGRPPDPPSIVGVRNEINEAALFGQYGYSLTSGLVAAIGGRLTYSRARGTLLDAPDQDADEAEPGRTDVRLSPTTTITWTPKERLLLFARYQQGFRAGGLAVLGGVEPEVQRFESDSITSVEAGLRFGRDGVSALTVQAALSYAAWNDVQADLIDPRGLPFTTNLGDGRIYGFEIDAVWRATPALSVDAALFVNDSALSRPAPAFAAVDERSLPNVADTGARASAHFRTQLSKSLALAIDGSVRYVGESHLGVGAPIEGEQGGFVEADLGARLAWNSVGLSCDVTNIGDGRGNRFSFGNPFSLTRGGQVTPLRPRTIRIGLDMAF